MWKIEKAVCHEYRPLSKPYVLGGRIATGAVDSFGPPALRPRRADEVERLARRAGYPPSRQDCCT
jgi:hypothetical protein